MEIVKIEYEFFGGISLRRDLGFYVEADVKSVYQAYLNAATHKPFERECKQEPFHTISFGMNYSFKYNMNGGSCTIHFMPSGSGTAVNMRFSIAQLAGARYEWYASNLNEAMQKFLPVQPQKARYDMEDFLKPQNQITPATPMANVLPNVQSVPAPAMPLGQPVVATGPKSGVEFCRKCGNQLLANARFCSKCGTAVPSPKTCPNCGKVVQEGNAFCSSCGTRL